jgi:riboflavin synthase
MFTGIVTAIGTIEQVERRADTHVTIACPWDPAGIAIGASIACSGVCLTVVERGGHAGDAWFAVDVSGETLACTVPGMWLEGQRLNLEPASMPWVRSLPARSLAVRPG